MMHAPTWTSRSHGLSHGQDEEALVYGKAAVFLLIGAALSTLCYGAAVGSEHRFASALASLLIAGAPLAVGLLVGFVFGIPRVQSSGAGAVYQPNTNLEQVSDWLTKLLIGVGLTQMTSLPAAVESMAELGAQGVGKGSSEGVIAAILLFFAIAGFLVGYNVTRLVLGPVIRAIEQPDAATVARVAAAPISPSRTLAPTIDEGDASELLRFTIDDLRTPEQFIAWGRAKLERNPDSGDAVVALEHAVDQAPDDRRAIENLVFAALYVPAPKGFRLAIRYAQRYLSANQRDPAANANLYAFLACAFGQAHRYEVKTNGAADAIESWRRQAIEAIKTTLKLDPSWKPVLRSLANPPTNDGENDLDSLKDDADVQELLQG